MIAFGSAFWGHRKGHPPLPVKKIISELSKEALVIKTPEPGTSCRCMGCHERVPDHNVSILRCTHKKKSRWFVKDGGKWVFPGCGFNGGIKKWEVFRKWRKKRKVLMCQVGQGERKRCIGRVGSCREKEDREIHIRVRSCKTCSVQVDGSSVPGWVDRDVNGAMKMRQVVLHYAATGERPWWNFPQKGNARKPADPSPYAFPSTSSWSSTITPFWCEKA